VNLYRKEEVCAIIPTLYPDNQFAERLRHISDQVGGIVIIDDSGAFDTPEYFQAVIQNMSNKTDIKIELLINKENTGQAASLNIGLKKAKELGFFWGLLLDDDSLVFDDLVSRLLKYYKRIKDTTGSRIGVIGMLGVPFGSIVDENYKTIDSNWMRKRGIMTSGSFLCIDTFFQIGLFREDFIIDFVDYDFCLRAKQKGFWIYQIQEPGLWHRLGQNTQREHFYDNKYSMIRIYYSYRNGMVLIKEYILKDVLLTIAIIISQIEQFFKLLFLSKDKQRVFKIIIRAQSDGWFNRLGKYH
jgi:rhamnosyltransferase